jgi:hypothetical protein
MGSPSWASPGCRRWCGDRATAVKKRWRKFSVQAALGHSEKRRRMGRGVVEDSEAGEALSWAREAVRRPGDDGNAAAVESSVEVALELDEGRRRAEMGAAKVK